MNGHPIGRTDRGYRHVSVSAFGSHPTTPWDPPIQSIWHDNSSHDNSEGHSNEDTSITSPHQPNPALSSAMSSSESHSPTRGITGRDALAPMQGLFALTPPQSARSGDQAADYRTSFAGEPLFDFQMLQTPGETTVRQRNVSEFGQTLRTGPDVVSTFLLSEVFVNASSLLLSYTEVMQQEMGLQRLYLSTLNEKSRLRSWIRVRLQAVVTVQNPRRCQEHSQIAF